MRPCIIMHQHCRPMPLKERNRFSLPNLVNVTLSIGFALHNNKICFPSAHKSSPYHNIPTSKSVPLLSPPSEIPLCTLQTGSPVTCCKHLSHIRSPWPNELPGLPEEAQHCLFNDTVLPCRTCCRLKTTSKVRQRNDPVRSRVFVTLGLPGLWRSATHLFARNAGATELLCYCDNRTLYWR